MLKQSREVSLSNGRGEKRDGKLEKRGGHSRNEVGRRTGIFLLGSWENFRTRKNNGPTHSHKVE